MDTRPRHSRPRLSRTWAQRLLLFLGAFVTISCLATATAVGYVYLRFGSLKHLPLTVHQAAPYAPENFLVVGSDSRLALSADAEAGDVDGSRTDTIMVVRIDPKAKSITLLSFPRDLWIPIAGTGASQRINTAYAHGPQDLIDTIEQDFAIQINHYIEVNFVSFKGLVDALGGVSLYFDTPVRDRMTGFHEYTPGCVSLTGDDALKYARSRHFQWYANGAWNFDPTADLGRITRQQIFVKKALSKVLDTNVLDLKRVYQLIDVAHQNVTTDAGLSISDLKHLADEYKAFSVSNLKTYTLPVQNFTTSGGAAVVRLLADKARPYLNEFRGLPPNALAEGDVSVSVLNGTGEPGKASAVAGALSQVGFNVGASADASGPAARTTIFYAHGLDAQADLVRRHLTGSADLVEDPYAAAGTVTLVIGPDFTTVMRVPYAPTTTTSTTAPSGSTSTTVHTTTTTSPPSTTSSTVIGHATGEPPPGVDC